MDHNHPFLEAEPTSSPLLPLHALPPSSRSCPSSLAPFLPLPHTLPSFLTPSPPPSHPAGPPVVDVPSPLIEDDHFGMVFSTLSPPTIPQHLYLNDKTFAPHITSHQITLVVFFFHCKNNTLVLALPSLSPLFRSSSSLPLSSLSFSLLPPIFSHLCRTNRR